MFDGESIYDSGTIAARGETHVLSVDKLARLLDRFSPEAVAHEQANGEGKRRERVTLLHGATEQLCRARNIDVYRYTKAEVGGCFGKQEPASRQDIAEAVAQQIDVLAPRLPSKRKPWQTQTRRMAIFTAAAVAITHIAKGRYTCD